MQKQKGENRNRERIGYWATHEYHKRSVEDLELKKFCGWKALLAMIEEVKNKDRYSLNDYYYCSERDASLIATTFETGGRISEVLQLKSEMFKIDDAWVQVDMPLLKRYRKHRKRDKESGKTITTTKPIQSTRKFVFPRREPLAEFVVQWVWEREDYLFPSFRKSKLPYLSPVRAYQIIVELGERIGLDMWPHRLRSERASQLAIEYKWDLEKLLRFFQWKSSDMAMRYAHKSVDDMKHAMPEISYDA